MNYIKGYNFRLNNFEIKKQKSLMKKFAHRYNYNWRDLITSKGEIINPRDNMEMKFYYKNIKKIFKEYKIHGNSSGAFITLISSKNINEDNLIEKIVMYNNSKNNELKLTNDSEFEDDTDEDVIDEDSNDEDYIINDELENTENKQLQDKIIELQIDKKKQGGEILKQQREIFKLKNDNVSLKNDNVSLTNDNVSLTNKVNKITEIVKQFGNVYN